MPNIEAIVLDLDGTLLNRDKSISPRNYMAVKSCFDSGMHVIVATARPPRAAQKFMKNLSFADYRVFYNGAMVTCTSKQIDRHISISTDVSLQITEFIASSATHAMLTYEVNDSWYTPIPILDSQCGSFGIRQTDPRPEVVNQDFIRTLSPTKILVLGYENWKDVIQSFGDHVHVVATDGGNLVQIMEKSASKENAVQWVLNDIGVNPEHVMIFGDDYNDLGLFRVCGFPVAMGNGIEELKSYAKYITESNDNDGVAVALEKLLLSRVDL